MRLDLMQNCQLSTTAKVSGGKDRRGYAVQNANVSQVGRLSAELSSHQ